MNPETHTCPICEYTWKHGQDGSHSCTEHLLRKIKQLETDLGDIRKVRLNPNDTLVIQVDSHLTDETYSHIKELMKQTFPENKCIVLEGGITLGVVEPSEKPLHEVKSLLTGKTQTYEFPSE